MVRDNKAQSRFELDVDGGVAFANYRLTPAAVIITHTETPRVLRGQGIASKLVEGALALIRADCRKVVGACGFSSITWASTRNTQTWWDDEQLSSFRGASETSEPGIHLTSWQLDKWIPGLRLVAHPGMTRREREFVSDSRPASGER